MIQFEQVTKSYNEFIALDHLTFEIKNGEFVFIAGHSGAGKSTLINLIAAVERPDSGQVFVNGQNITTMRRAAIPYIRRHIGLVFQDHKILFDRDVLNNILLPLNIIGFDHRLAKKRAMAALEKVGLLGKEKLHPVSLSGGEQQRLCIARAVVHRPTILLADEPTGNLDQAYALDIMELFKSFHQAGVTVIIAAHDETLMADYGRRVLRLRKGQFTT